MNFTRQRRLTIWATTLCALLCGTTLLAQDRGRGGDHDDGDHDDSKRARVVTYHNDVRRTGWNGQEHILTPQTVSQTAFGWLKTVVLDDQVDAEPLLVDDIKIDHHRHAVVYVVTENNTVYAIDAESGAVLKQRHLGTPVPRPLNCENNGNAVGINSTPTIDVSARTLYLISYRMSGSTPIHELHALDLD